MMGLWFDWSRLLSNDRVPAIVAWLIWHLTHTIYPGFFECSFDRFHLLKFQFWSLSTGFRLLLLVLARLTLLIGLSCWCTRIWVFPFFEKMLWFSVEVCFAFLFCASIAPNSACKVVILTLTADPTSIWEREVFFLFLIISIISLIKLWDNFLLGTFFLLLVLCPFKRTDMEIFIFLSFRFFFRLFFLLNGSWLILLVTKRFLLANQLFSLLRSGITVICPVWGVNIAFELRWPLDCWFLFLNLAIWLCTLLSLRYRWKWNEARWSCVHSELVAS